MNNATLLTCTPDTPEWHAIRAQGIGGSDAAAALGLSKWKTPYQLWEEKTGQAEPVVETWEMARGKALEPLLRQHYSDTTGREVRVPRGVLQHQKHFFMIYNPDGLSDDDGYTRMQEFKTAGYDKDWGEEHSDEIPQEYLLQVQHGMAIVGAPVCDVTVSIAANRPRYFEVEADKELQEMLIDREANFWEFVRNETAPPAQDAEDLNRMHKTLLKSYVTAPPDMIEALNELKVIKAAIKADEVRKEEYEFVLKSFIGAHEALCDDYGTILATWKHTKPVERFKKDELKKIAPEIYTRFVEIGAPQRRLLLK